MYEIIENELIDASQLVILRDFNARIGQHEPGERYVGSHGLRNRNDRRQRLAEFAEFNKLYVTNTLFKQNDRRLWTWESPKRAHHQIDCVLSNRGNNIVNCKAIGLSQCDTRSDHRLVRLSLKIGLPRKIRRCQSSQSIKAEDARNTLTKVTNDE